MGSDGTFPMISFLGLGLVDAFCNLSVGSLPKVSMLIRKRLSVQLVRDTLEVRCGVPESRNQNLWRGSFKRGAMLL